MSGCFGNTVAGEPGKRLAQKLAAKDGKLEREYDALQGDTEALQRQLVLQASELERLRLAKQAKEQSNLALRQQLLEEGRRFNSMRSENSAYAESLSGKAAACTPAGGSIAPGQEKAAPCCAGLESVSPPIGNRWCRGVDKKGGGAGGGDFEYLGCFRDTVAAPDLQVRRPPSPRVRSHPPEPRARPRLGLRALFEPHASAPGHTPTIRGGESTTS